MAITEISRRRIGTRLKGSLGGIVVGILLVCGASIAHWWNEGRAVKTARGLDEGYSLVVSGHSEEINPSNDGKLVHVIGDISAAEKITDNDFGVAITALKLKRSVHMFQWTEKSKTETEKKLGGAEESVTTYSYEPKWKSKLIQSSKFKQPSGHENPSAYPYISYTANTSRSMLGSYAVSDWILSSVNDYEWYEWESWDNNKFPNARKTDDNGRPGTSLYIGSGEPGDPDIGDIKVQFQYVPSGTYSVIAKQSGNRLEPFNTSTGSSIAMVRTGAVDASAMFEQAHTQNTFLTWLIRIIGFVIVWVGVRLVFRPLVVLADVVPAIGRIVGIGVNFLSFLLAAVIASFVVALAWIWYRPLIGLTLLGVALIIIVYLVRKRSTSKDKFSEITTS